MIFIYLFLVFSKIGIFNFGGGYAMLSLIQNEVVMKHQWMTSAEFTDMVAISQMTPGPIGINAATYVGYTAVVKAGFPEYMGILGSVLASLSVIWLPFILMIMISNYLIKHKDSHMVASLFKVLRPVIIGLIASAALLLMSKDNFGSWTDSRVQFCISVALFVAAFVAVRKFNINPITVIILSAVAGLVIYDSHLGWVMV